MEKILALDSIDLARSHLALYEYLYKVNGQYMGSYTLDLTNPYSPNGRLNMDYIRHGVGRQGGFEVSNNFKNGASRSSGTPLSRGNGNGRQVVNNYLQGNGKRAGSPTDLALADPIQSISLGLNGSTTFPPLATGQMMANSGTNYSQLAEIAYGDSSYASLLDTHDGQPSLAAPVSLPPILPMFNKATTYIPRDQVLAQMAAAFYPVMKAPNMEDDNWFDAFVSFVAIGIGVAIGTAIGGPMGAVVGGIVAAEIDLTGQALGEKMGLTDHFPLQEGLDTGLQAALMTYFAAGTFGANISQASIGQAVLVAGETAVAQQLTEMALGWRRSFDVKSVAASMASAAVSSSLGKTLSQGLAADETENLAGTMASSLIANQNLELDQLAGTALGTAVVRPVQAQAEARAKALEQQQERARYEEAVNYMNSLGASAENPPDAQSARTSRAARYNQQSSQSNRDNQSKWGALPSMADVANATENQLLQQAFANQALESNPNIIKQVNTHGQTSYYDKTTDKAYIPNGNGYRVINGGASEKSEPELWLWAGSDAAKLGMLAINFVKDSIVSPAALSQAVGRLGLFAQDVPKDILASSPSAIARGYGELSSRQAEILAQLPSDRSIIQVYKSDINVTDLAALTAKTGDEYAMFTLGSRRLIVRGNSMGIRIEDQLFDKLQNESWTWSAHVHPGTSDVVLNASGFPGDRAVLDTLGQSRSLILNSAGRRNVFDLENDIRITPKSEYKYVDPTNRLTW